MKGGISHFIEHMVFKGTTRRTQLEIAQEMDAIGGQTDAFTTKEYASFNAKVLDEHVPQVVDLLADIVLNPSFDSEELERERKVIFEEIKMVEDTPDDLVHEIFIESFWPITLLTPHSWHAGDGRGARSGTAPEVLPGDLYAFQPDRVGCG